MTLFELSKDQVKELRGNYAVEHLGIQCPTKDDVTDEMLVEEYGNTEFSNDDFMAKPRECAENYEVAVDFEETEWCANCDNESTIFWDIRKDGFRAYCPHCGEELTLCDACMHRFGNMKDEWSNCGNCPVKEDGFIEDDVYDWGGLELKKTLKTMSNEERLEVMLMNFVDYVDELLAYEDEGEFNDFLRDEMGFTEEEIIKYSPYPHNNDDEEE